MCSHLKNFNIVLNTVVDYFIHKIVNQISSQTEKIDETIPIGLPMFHFDITIPFWSALFETQEYGTQLSLLGPC